MIQHTQVRMIIYSILSLTLLATGCGTATTANSTVHKQTAALPKTSDSSVSGASSVKFPDGFQSYSEVFSVMGKFLANRSSVPVMLPKPSTSRTNSSSGYLDVQYKLNSGYDLALSYGPKLPVNSPKIVDGTAENLVDVAGVPAGTRTSSLNGWNVVIPNATVQSIGLGNGITGTMYSGTDPAMDLGSQEFHSVVWKENGWTFGMAPVTNSPAEFLPNLRQSVQQFAALHFPVSHGSAVLGVEMHPFSQAEFDEHGVRYVLNSMAGNTAIVDAASMVPVQETNVQETNVHKLSQAAGLTP